MIPTSTYAAVSEDDSGEMVNLLPLDFRIRDLPITRARIIRSKYWPENLLAGHITSHV